MDGIAGYNGGTITKSINNATVSANQHVGGITSYNIGTITESINNAIISANKKAGGIVGVNIDGGTITKSINNATVSANSDVGGIAGMNGRSTIQDCYNRGNVTSIGYNADDNLISCTGGITGSNYDASTIEGCYNTGNVTASYPYVGGIVGYNGNDDSQPAKLVKNVFNTGTIKMSSTVASSNIGSSSAYVGYLIGRWGSLSGKYGNTTLADMSTWTSETIETNLSSEFINDEKNDKGEWIYNDGYPILKWQVEE